METQRRASSTIPFGWRLSTNAPGLLEIVEDEQEGLKQAIEYCKMGCSVRETARWLSATTGRYLSNKGLQHIWGKSNSGEDQTA